MNKLKQKQKQELPEERNGPGDYYLVVAQYSTWYVSPERRHALGACWTGAGVRAS